MATKNTTPPIATPEMLNAIRETASPAYQNAVPVATRANLLDVGNPIINYSAVANEFVDAIMNKIVLQLIDRRMWDNPLSFLRREKMPLGTDVEEVHTNPAEALKYDGTETGMADLLKIHKPDVATTYYRLNRQDKYPVTINNDQLRGAFTMWPKLESFISSIVDSLYMGANIDDFKYTKSLVSEAIAGNHIVQQVVTAPTGEQSGKDFMKTLRSLSVLFTFPSTNYNSYALISGKPARTTLSPISEQVILIRADIASAIGVDVLSTLFNVSYGEYLARQIIVDDFGDNKTLAVLCDVKAFLIMEQLRQFATFFNASSLGWQYYYHCWDLYSLSPFYNMVALVTA